MYREISWAVPADPYILEELSSYDGWQTAKKFQSIRASATSGPVSVVKCLLNMDWLSATKLNLRIELLNAERR